MLNSLKQACKYYLLKHTEAIGRRICTRSILRNAKKKVGKRNILYVTGATAGSCGTLLYFSISLQEPRNLADAYNYRVCTHSLMHQEDDEVASDYFFDIGWEDEWLVFPFYPWGIHIRKQNVESNAFNKLSIPEILSPWELSSSNDPWVLLQLTKSNNFWIRQMGVASLAEKSCWEAFEYRNVAQACDERTVVGLARYPQANDAFFLPPPKLHKSENDIITDMQSLIKKMPLPETANNNIHLYRTLALQRQIRFQKDPLTMDLIALLYSVPGEEVVKQRESLDHCLRSLQAYTTEQDYAIRFAQLHGLALLQRLREEFREEDSVQLYVLAILANLSQVSELVADIIRTGWVYELRKWSVGSKSVLSILAHTILANLDRDWITNYLYQDMVLLHPSQRNSHPVYADIVLVHGVRGGAVKTWRQKDSENTEQNSSYSHCWPKDWLASDINGVRIISVGYDTSLHRWGDHWSYDQDKRRIDGRCEELRQKLRKAGVGSRPIIWMGHSLGGLLIKQILVSEYQDRDSDRLLKETKGIIMFSVPHRGSGLVDIMMHARYLLFPSVEVQELATSSPKLRDLHCKFLELIATNPIPSLSFGENRKTDIGRRLPGTIIVSKESSDPGIGQFISLDANHIDSCKPCGKNDPIYQNTKAFIHSILANSQSGPK